MDYMYLYKSVSNEQNMPPPKVFWKQNTISIDYFQIH